MIHLTPWTDLDIALHSIRAAISMALLCVGFWWVFEDWPLSELYDYPKP